MSKKQQAELTKEQYLQGYELMLLIRRFEEKAGGLYGMGLIAGFCHLYIGQEAVIAGLKLAMHEKDPLVTSYRDHGHILAAGMDPKYVMAELMGRRDGCSKGKGGSMHMFDLENKFYGGHGIVGAQVPIGTGIAFAEKYKDTKNVCLTFLGDGAVHQGQVYESFNMASLWNLPVLYIIENNKYAMGTAVHRATVVTDLCRKGESFGIDAVQIDGMNMEEVYHYGKQALDNIRKTNKPFIIEVLTYRYRGHSMSDPAKYRDKSEVEGYKNNCDPINLVKDILLKKKYATENDLKAIEKRVKDQVNEAVEFSQNSPLPDESELLTEVYQEV